MTCLSYVLKYPRRRLTYPAANGLLLTEFGRVLGEAALACYPSAKGLQTPGNVRRIMAISRRNFIVLGASSLGIAACDSAIMGNGVNSNAGQKIDARVEATKDYLLTQYPGAQSLTENAKGVLYMPLVTDAGFGFGGAYGRGALQINGMTVDYYSATSASFGFQIGAQQYAHAIFFLTEDALQKFRASNGWAAGAGIEYATPAQGASIGKDTTELDPVVALIFGQQGLIAGATLQGVKYSRIIP